jgi:hypothetical protein
MEVNGFHYVRDIQRIHLRFFFHKHMKYKAYIYGLSLNSVLDTHHAVLAL